MLALLVLPPAFAEDIVQHLSWQVALDGTSIGKRDVTVRWVAEDDGDIRRILEVWTELDASVLGLDYSLRQRIAATAVRGPASFDAVTRLQSDTMDVQGRVDGTDWMLSIAQNGHEWHKDLPRPLIDMSTVDLVDPDTRVPFAGLTVAHILAAETGDVLEGAVASLPSKQIAIAGESVPVVGWSWTPDQGEMRFWYSPEGYLVRYETEIMGRWIVGTLIAPPPKGTDEAPVDDGGGTGITEIKL